jgi:hypothetical protein
MNKTTQIDALREARLGDMPDYEPWLERFFGRVAPWVDTAGHFIGFEIDPCYFV